MRETKLPFGRVFRINVQGFMACLLGWFAVTIFPDQANNWGWSVISILCGSGAFSCALKAVREISRLYEQQCVIYAQYTTGREMDNAQLADTDTLIEHGVRDDYTV